jgi:hypothetical protein
MPQARLPDVNTAFITYRREAIVNIKTFDHRGAWGSLFSINALLPNQYRIIIDDEKFAEESKTNFLYTCNFCIEKTDRTALTIYLEDVGATEFLLTNEETVKVWDCIKCNETNILSETNIIKDELALPSYIHAVPSPPKRLNGLLGRGKYRKEFTAWAWNFLHELEERMGQFRDDNWSKDEEYKEGSDVDTSAEEEDSEAEG